MLESGRNIMLMPVPERGGRNSSNSSPECGSGPLEAPAHVIGLSPQSLDRHGIGPLTFSLAQFKPGILTLQ